MSDEQKEHWMVGRRVKTMGRRGTVDSVNQHTIEEGGDRETIVRVIVELDETDSSGDKLFANVGSADVEVL